MCVFYIFSKYEWIFPLKDKKYTTITNAFQNILDNSNHKPNKIWIHKGSESYNRSIKSWFQGKNVMKESRLLLKGLLEPWKIKYIDTDFNFKNAYANKLDDTVNEYNNTHHSTIKMKTDDVKSSAYTSFEVGNNDTGLKIEVGDCVRISKNKNIFIKDYAPNWS